MVNPIIGMRSLTKVLMDGGSGLNIMYTKTLDAMGIDQSRVRPTGAPFHGIVLGKQAVPCGQIDLPITFDRSDHSDSIPQPGRYPLVVDPIVGMKRLTKVLMDGGSGLNILYVDTLDAMRIPWSELRPVSSPFHGVILGT